jgi:YfiH family protein
MRAARNFDRVLQRRTADNGVVFYASPLLERAGVPHAFSTRIGGISPAPFDSLNLGNPSGCDRQDDYDRIYRNYDLLQSAAGFSANERCWVHQVHGGHIAAIWRGEPFENGVKADAMVSDDPGRILAVRVADCVPVLLALQSGERVAAIHAGWRGIIAKVVPAAMEIVKRDSKPADLIAAIGPSIGFDAFEVGPEVAAQFELQFPSAGLIRRLENEKALIDLRGAIASQLRFAGLKPDQIDTTDRCTFRDADEFFSHRRDHGITGRMAALISPLSVSAVEVSPLVASS